MAVPFLGYATAAQQKAQQEDPIKQFVQGYGTVQTLQNQATRGNLLNLELEKAQRQQEALKGYGETGDIAALMQKDPVTALALTEKQYQIADHAVKHWDNTKWGLTRETYGPWREDFLKKFPMVNQSLFPDPSTFKTDEDFTKFKNEKERMKAEYERLKLGPKAIAPGGALVGPSGQEIYRNPVKPLQEREYPVYDAEGNLIDSVTGTGRPFQLRKPKEEQRPTNFENLYQQELKTRPGLTRKQLRIEMIEKETVAKTKPLTPKQIAEGEIAKRKAERQKKWEQDTGQKTTAPTPSGIVHTSDHELTPEEAAALLKQMEK